MLASDILIDIFHFLKRKSLQNTICLTDRRSSSIVPRYLAEKPYFVLKNISVTFDTSSSLSLLPHEFSLKNDRRKSSNEEISAECRVFKNEEFWVKLLEETPMPAYLRTTQATFYCYRNWRSDVDVVRQLQKTWTGYPNASVEFHFVRLTMDIDYLVKMASMAIVPRIAVHASMSMRSFVKFLDCASTRQCQTFTFYSDGFLNDKLAVGGCLSNKAAISRIIAWLQDETPRAGAKTPRFLNVGHINYSKKFGELLADAAILAFVCDDQKREYNLNLTFKNVPVAYQSQRFAHEKDGEILSIDQNRAGIFIQRQMRSKMELNKKKKSSGVKPIPQPIQPPTVANLTQAIIRRL